MNQVNRNPGGGDTNEVDPGEFTEGGTGALDPNEKWGQGPDLSHPETTTQDVPGGATPAGPDDDASLGRQRAAP